MALVAEATYRRLTGDTTSDAAEVVAALADAQGLLQDALRRPLESAERTEVVSVWADGLAYPLATPITAVPAGMTVEGHGVRGAVDGGTLTYTGGWTAATLPMTLSEALCAAARAQLHPNERGPIGARAYAVGDVNVSRDTPVTAVHAWGADVLAYKRREV